MGKHYTKAELLEHVKHAKKMSRDANRVGFYVISVLGCYCMWKHEGWGQERLQRYLQQVYTYWYGDEELDKWNERLEKVAGFPVTVTYLS